MTDTLVDQVEAAVRKFAPGAASETASPTRLTATPGLTVGRDRSKHGPVNFVLAPHIIPLLGYWAKLDRIYAGFKRAAEEVERARAAPVCVDGCGKCCESTVPLSTGAEAEYAASMLVGTPNLKKVLDRARDWLTSKPPWTELLKPTYGNTVTQESFQRKLAGEIDMVLTHESCPFLDDDKSCLVWQGRPAVCRAYGVTHVPNQWCERPIGAGETEDSRVSWDASVPTDPDRPSIKQQYNKLRQSIGEPRYGREGFFPTMIFERYRAAELAGFVDDGKIPTARMTVGWGGHKMILWQEDVDAAWSNAAADESISQQVPLKEIDGKLVMTNIL